MKKIAIITYLAGAALGLVSCQPLAPDSNPLDVTVAPFYRGRPLFTPVHSPAAQPVPPIGQPGPPGPPLPPVIVPPVIIPLPPILGNGPGPFPPNP